VYEAYELWDTYEVWNNTEVEHPLVTSKDQDDILEMARATVRSQKHNPNDLMIWYVRDNEYVAAFGGEYLATWLRDYEKLRIELAKVGGTDEGLYLFLHSRHRVSITENLGTGGLINLARYVAHVDDVQAQGATVKEALMRAYIILQKKEK